MKLTSPKKSTVINIALVTVALVGVSAAYVAGRQQTLNEVKEVESAPVMIIVTPTLTLSPTISPSVSPTATEVTTTPRISVTPTMKKTTVKLIR
ncbi:MAG: hypothetical protein M3P33_02725 [bacterium]|nr:hypothetical protein [bacterium]